MDDHDQRLKSLLRLFLPELLTLLFPPWSARFDAAAAEWQDKEVFADPPTGKRRFLDLLAKVPIRPNTVQLPADSDEHFGLVHIEVESAERTTIAKDQLWRGYTHLRKSTGMAVLSIAIYLNVGLDGIGEGTLDEDFGELKCVRFSYLYAGLSALDALQYVEGENLLGVGLSALMKVSVEEAPLLGAKALQRIAESGLDDQRKYLLAECVEAYLPLDAAGRAKFETLIGKSEFKGAKAMNKTSREIGIEEGVTRGVRIGKQSYVVDMLNDRFGPLPESVLAKIEASNEQELRRLGVAMVKADSLKELGLEG